MEYSYFVALTKTALDAIGVVTEDSLKVFMNDCADGVAERNLRFISCVGPDLKAVKEELGDGFTFFYDISPECSHVAKLIYC